MIKIASFLALLGVAVAGPVGFNQLGYGATYAAAPGYGATYAAAPGYGAVAHPGYATYAAPTAYRTVAAPAVAHYAAAPTVVRAVAPEPYDHHPQYNYGYSVSDGYTGDQKSHSESRDGDVVSGQYSLVEPDGALRTVTYTADPVNGFNAVVDRQAPGVVKAAVAPAPIVRAALPVAAGPVAYGQYGAYNQAAYLSPYAGHNAHGLQYIQ